MNGKSRKKLIGFIMASILLGVSVLGVCTMGGASNASTIKPKKIVGFHSGVDLRRNLSNNQIESLYKLCKVWGYAKYYHPTVVAGEVDWDKELFTMIPLVAKAKNQDETNKIIYEWLSKYTFENTTTKEEFDSAMQSMLKDNFISINDMSWISDETVYGKEICSYLEKLSYTCVAQRDKSYAYINEFGELGFDNEKNYEYTVDDDGLELLALFRYWNAFNYYSPNVHLTDENWDTVLKEGIEKIVKVDDFDEYYYTIASIIAKTNDGHVQTLPKDNMMKFNNYYGEKRLPCAFEYIDGKVVVSYVSEECKELKSGDILLKIDNTTMSNRIQCLSQYTCLSTPDKIEANMFGPVLNVKGDKAKVTVLRDGRKLKFTVKSIKDYIEKKDVYSNGLIKDDIGYIDIGTIKEGDIEKLMSQYMSTKGIIIDLRKYPSVSGKCDLLSEYFVPKLTEFVKFGMHLTSVPGAFFYNYSTCGAGATGIDGQDKNYPLYKGKLMVLVDEHTLSQGETMAMALSVAPNATLVGTNTLGAVGIKTPITLPGNIISFLSSIGQYQLDGENVQRVGVAPDVKCAQTLQGVKEGRDEVVEMAIDLIYTEVE